MNAKRNNPDIGRLECALVGAALSHVNQTLELKRRGLHPDQIEDMKLREILRACYALEPVGLMETAEETASVILDHLQHRGVNISAYDLGQVADGAAWPGTHFERVYAVWKKAFRARQEVAKLEELTNRAKNGELDPDELTSLIGGAV